MALSPPPSLTRSPSSSSITYCASERSSLDYPSPPDLADQHYRLSSIYGSDQRCSMTPPMDSDPSLPPLGDLCQPEWTGSTLLHPSSSGAAMPSILSSNYDTYEGYDSVLPPPYGHDIYQAHHSQSHNVHSSTPPPTGAISRSPDPSLRSTVSYTSASSLPGSLTPRIKMEHGIDYGQGLEVSRHPSPRSLHTTYATDSGSYTGSTSGYLSDGQSSWRTSDFQSSVELGQYYDGTATSSPFTQDTRRPYRVARPRRTPRRLTTREEANFQCEVKGCGKLFSRSYNFKAHMETHDDKREYPFPCLADDCNKKFVRKTDLQRHHQSVHMKERNHKCDYCGRLFARKDTLRRHMEDGCSKRFDIGTLDLRDENYETSHSSGRQPGVGPLNFLGPPPGVLPPMSLPPLGSNSGILTSTTASMRSRDLADDQNQEHTWGR
ncbi:hypothetical protein CONLIGDRAFT_459829 [Coniochaeta ligniaria NRRL 30616]|uniref:C2H2-type domain-containing protein n=1 Tax=Coniochaeta ligniaria NRRL 30616 TaxID=1408157 RepID=A0A1J7IKF1_9PEZI|nr:hypothetical protein CONLIGDRAFT_459829 [Coniochaeta ligniaria NRRL 30616]